LYAKYHGETEQNLRSALASADQLAPCVLWIDEIEKGVAGDGGDSDGGVSRRVLGYLLTWMAERKAPVFVVATANQVQHLPAELLRKGRFDEIFFVDLPAPDTRVELLRIHLGARGLAADDFALPALAAAANGFSGAEIEQAIVSGLYAAHAEQRPLDTELLMEEIRGTRPLSVLMSEQVEALRDWALPRPVPADCAARRLRRTAAPAARPRPATWPGTRRCRSRPAPRTAAAPGRGPWPGRRRRPWSAWPIRARLRAASARACRTAATAAGRWPASPRSEE